MPDSEVLAMAHSLNNPLRLMPLGLTQARLLCTDKRKEESHRMLERHPMRVPVIVLRSEKSRLPEMKQCKFLAPSDLTGDPPRLILPLVGQFLLVVRRRINLLPTQTVFLFAEKTESNKTTHCLAATR